MSEQAKRFATGKTIAIRNPVIECSEQGRYCMKRFIKTRQGQTDVCINCIVMLDGELPELIKCKNKNWKI